MAWQSAFEALLITLNQILTAGIAITAFSLLLYALAFNLRNEIARSFALILLCVVFVFTSDALGSSSNVPASVELWLRLQWVGILMLPAAYLQFSDALLATTGKPSQGKRRLAVRLAYIASYVTLLLVPTGLLLGPVVIGEPPAAHLRPTLLTDLYILYYFGVMAASWYNFVRAYRRTRTATSRRRMGYLITGALAPALGSFPFLLYGSQFAAVAPGVFWVVALISNLAVGALVVVMAYAVAFFGVPWPDRVVKGRLFNWLLRGPATASLALAFTTLVRRAGEAFGLAYNPLVPIVMVATVLLFEYLITLFAPLGERALFSGKDRADLKVIRDMEERLLTRKDLNQFLELVLSAVCDRLQTASGEVLAFNSDGLEQVVSTGRSGKPPEDLIETLTALAEKEDRPRLIFWQTALVLPLYHGPENNLVGAIVVDGVAAQTDDLDDEQIESLEALADRAALALTDRRLQEQIFSSLSQLSSQVEVIQRMSAAGRYDTAGMFQVDEIEPDNHSTQSVKEALTHYWGGPRLTQSPLLQLKVVQDARGHYDGNSANALRAILKEAVERLRPDGERKFTGEWILYNILEMKFLEGKKVKEIAMRLSMSEADLYRKQRIAIESVAQQISEMENQARRENDTN